MSTNNETTYKKLLYLGPTLFVLPDNFKGSYKEAIILFLKKVSEEIITFEDTPTDSPVAKDNQVLLDSLTKYNTDIVWEGCLYSSFLQLSKFDEKTQAWSNVEEIVI